jgi:hypothetical protein
MRKVELRLGDSPAYGDESGTKEPSAAPHRTVGQGNQDPSQQSARRLGLVLMGLSSLLMIALFGAAWLLMRRLL